MKYQELGGWDTYTEKWIVIHVTNLHCQHLMEMRDKNTVLTMSSTCIYFFQYDSVKITT